MSDKDSKFHFFKKLKKAVLNSETNTENLKEIKDDLVEESLKTKKFFEKETLPTDKNEVLPYKSVSMSEFLDEKFAENFVNSGGKFVYCENNKEFFNFLNSLKNEKQWNHVFSWNYDLLDYLQQNKFQQNDLEVEMADADAALSYCYSLSANKGVVVLSPEQATNRRLVNFPKTHLIIAYKNQLKATILEAISGFNIEHGERLPSLLELHKGKPVCKEYHKELLNADGPTDVYLFYIDTDIVD